MKKRARKTSTRQQDWILVEAEKLRQECNELTGEQRRKAREHALEIVYGTNATAPAGRR
jgi:hypothetical protein